MAETTGRPVRIVPHFMRLHEWIALDEGYFTAEGLAPDLRPDVISMRRRSRSCTAQPTHAPLSAIPRSAAAALARVLRPRSSTPGVVPRED